MINIITIYIHAEDLNCYTREDFCGYKLTNKKQDAEKFIKTNQFEISKVTEIKSLKTRVYILKPFEYSTNMSVCKSLFSSEVPKEYEDYINYCNNKLNKERKKQGFISCKYAENMTFKDYYGSLDKLLTKRVKKYINNKYVFGYLGHEDRKHIHDTILEEEVAKNYPNDNSLYEKIGDFLCSSGGRHWMDTHGDDNEEDFRAAVDNIINF